MPEAVTDIHRQYLAAGADIVETNTFNSSPIGMEEFALPPKVMREVNLAAAACAAGGGGRVQPSHAAAAAVRGRFDRADRQADRHLDQGRGCQLSGRDLRRNGRHRITSRWRPWSKAGVDILLPETVIDTLNLKACLVRH